MTETLSALMHLHFLLTFQKMKLPRHCFWAFCR